MNLNPQDWTSDTIHNQYQSLVVWLDFKCVRDEVEFLFAVYSTCLVGDGVDCAVVDNRLTEGGLDTVVLLVGSL